MTSNDIKNLLDASVYNEVVRYFLAKSGVTQDAVEQQVIECLRYLYLLSRYPEKLGGLFLPVEQGIDEIWHYLILQTREYRALCEDYLPGGFFIHHRSLPYATYLQQPERQQLIEESLRWLPLYCDEFGAFDDKALPHWTMVKFLHQEVGMSLSDISLLGRSAHA